MRRLDTSTKANSTRQLPPSSLASSVPMDLGSSNVIGIVRNLWSASSECGLRWFTSVPVIRQDRWS